ncbi:MAG TPA: phosphatidylinositol mannoside acyltransferase [Euzebyales bacterium]|nr:phosphatidylinositol mannoside acyltransferase [Euzebyales bacterium]
MTVADGSQGATRVPSYRGSGIIGRPVDRRPGAAERVPQRRPDTRRQRVVGALWLAAWQLARWVPEAVAFRLADAAALLAARRAGHGRDRVRANLARVVAPHVLDATVTRAYRSYARYWVEAFRVADIGAADIASRVDARGLDLLDDVLERGRGAIVLLAHHGSWDVAARWAEVHGYHLAVVAEIVRPRALFARFVRLREEMGLEVVPLEPRASISGRGIGARLGDVLGDNHLVGLLTDRDLSGRAPMVDFFGKPCRLPLGATVLAKRYRAPVVPTAMLQLPGRRWRLQILEPRWLHDLEIRDAQRQVAAALEEVIRLDPAQWHAFQRIWSTSEPSAP